MVSVKGLLCCERTWPEQELSWRNITVTNLNVTSYGRRWYDFKKSLHNLSLCTHILAQKQSWTAGFEWHGQDCFCAPQSTRNTKGLTMSQIPLGWWQQNSFCTYLSYLLGSSSYCEVGLCLRILPTSVSISLQAGCCPLSAFQYLENLFEIRVCTLFCCWAHRKRIVIFRNVLLSFCQSTGTFTGESAVLGSTRAAGHQVMAFTVIVYL